MVLKDTGKKQERDRVLLDHKMRRTLEYDAEMKAAAEEEAVKSQTPVQQPEKIGIEKRIREGKDDKVFKVCKKY